MLVNPSHCRRKASGGAVVVIVITTSVVAEPDRTGFGANVHGMAIVSNDTATDPLRIAIARTLGLCCDPDVIAGVVFWPPGVFDWNTEGPEKTRKLHSRLLRPARFHVVPASSDSHLIHNQNGPNDIGERHSKRYLVLSRVTLPAACARIRQDFFVLVFAASFWRESSEDV
jgi:hypothetical protein